MCPEVPADLAGALTADGPARLFYERLGRSVHCPVPLRLMTARAPHVRAARLQRVVASLAAGRKVR
ncbi:YdeI/OmpD-associated family protein [Streptomyces sp. NBC_00876]|uniref:YdeI/OmpD-associated family protein n=1 Tax=Streptomyces sp. NBC_00876 TaxID=2975853 RepID=UPI003864223D|nr:YdeI/OmpD-associated family protein [Streptomyces sp. NBC_00876]